MAFALGNRDFDGAPGTCWIAETWEMAGHSDLKTSIENAATHGHLTAPVVDD